MSSAMRSCPGRARAWPGFAAVSNGWVLVAHRLIVKIGPILVLEGSMRLTIDVDDESLTRAAALTGVDDHAALIRRALELLVRIESGQQLCALGGSDRDAAPAPRRRV